MNRLLLALAIFATGTTVFCAYRTATSATRRVAADQQAVWQTQTQLLAQVRITREELQQRIRTAKAELAALPAESATEQLAKLCLAENGLQNLSPEQSERLLAELGFNWNTTSDYVIVSKRSLGNLSLDGMKGMKLTDTARAVLGITPDESATLDTLTQRLGADHAAWVTTHAQRQEITGSEVAKYTLPVNSEFSQGLSNAFVSGISSALGPQRGDLLRQYSLTWMQNLGMLAYPAEFNPEPTTLTVSRYGDGNGRLNYVLKSGGNSMSTDVSPWQTFPEAFRPLFPGGWKDLAQREGFALPKEFEKKSPR